MKPRKPSPPATRRRAAKSEIRNPKSKIKKARYIMLGGFLGAGKTTAVAQLARWLTERGHRVGLITNDQAGGLVDTALLTSRGFPVEEIAGGCFCCRFNSLTDAARKLTDAVRPDVFIAEPVGSCTDLVATVTYPLRRLYGEAYTIAPLSVLVDAVRAARVLGLAEGAAFSDKVRYIYRKQLEEADVLVVNKTDLLPAAQLKKLEQCLKKEFPGRPLFRIAARTGKGLEEWFEHITRATQTARAAMPVDYDIYADGEALLGWLNATVKLSAKRAFNGNTALRRLATDLQKRLRAAGAEIAHLKMTLDPGDALGALAAVNLVRSDHVAELSQELESTVRGGELILNLRAEAAPDVLRTAVEAALAALNARPGPRAALEHIECFQPGRPQPTHRDGGG